MDCSAKNNVGLVYCIKGGDTMNTDTLDTLDLVQRLTFCSFVSGFLASLALSGIIVVLIFSLLFGLGVIMIYITIRSKELKRQCSNEEA